MALLRRRQEYAAGPATPASEKAAQLRQLLTNRQLHYVEEMPDTIKSGSITFLATDERVTHQDFVTEAWTAEPIADLLSRINSYSHKRH